MKTLMVAIDKIHVPDVRVTAQYDEELLVQLRGSLAAVGQVQPIVVQRAGEGFELIDGLHRLQEAKARGDRAIPAVVYDGEAADVLLLNLVTNHLRGKIRVGDMIKVVDALVHTHGLDSEAIAKRTGYSRDYVEKLWKVSEISPAILEALDGGKIPFGVAYEVSRLAGFEMQERVGGEAIAFGWTVKWAKEEVDAILTFMSNPTPVVEKPVAPSVSKPKCGICGQEEESSRLAVLMLCRPCYGATYDVAQKRLADIGARTGIGRGGSPDTSGLNPPPKLTADASPHNPLPP